MKTWKKLLTATLTMAAVLGSTVGAGAEEPLEMEKTVTSYLTGESVSEKIGRRRPVAIMLGNSVEGAPQSGISNAGVVYEAPVEGDITRLMGIFEDYDNLERIGSVRSCRDYYIFYAKEFDAIYAHFGQAVYALQYLDQHVIDNLNGLTMENTAFFRTSDRRAPHNAYTDAQYLKRGMESLGYGQEYSESYRGHYLFAENGTETIPEGEDAQVLRLNNFKDCRPWFEYDANTKTYRRFQFDKPHVDELNNEQLTCSNIILQYSSYQPYDANGYLNIDTSSGGEGRFLTRGKVMDIRWEKNPEDGITRYYDSNNEEIRLNPGKTWVEIIQNDRIDSILYE